MGSGRRRLWGPDERVHGITGYEDCRQAIACTELESQIDNSNLQQSSSNLLFLDGDTHDRIRDVVSGAIPSWKSTGEASGRFAEQLLGGMPGRWDIDLVNDFAVPIAENAACSVLGLANDDPGELAPVLAAMTGLFDPGSDQSTLDSSRQAGGRCCLTFDWCLRQKAYAMRFCPGSAQSGEILWRAVHSGNAGVGDHVGARLVSEFDEPAQFCVVGDHVQPRYAPAP